MDSAVSADITWNGKAASYSIKPHGKFIKGRTRQTDSPALIKYAQTVLGFSVQVHKPKKPAKVAASETPDETLEADDKGKGSKGAPRRGGRR